MLKAVNPGGKALRNNHDGKNIQENDEVSFDEKFENFQLKLIETNFNTWGNSERLLRALRHDERVRNIVQRKGNELSKALCKQYEKLVEVDREKQV